MINKNLKKLEEKQQFEDSSNELPPSDIVAFNELRSCADLLRLYESKQLDIKPDFQRDVVWSKPDQTRFIDSLTKQLPIPSMCISLDYKTDKRLVIDGLQRISSIINFLSDDEWKLSELDDIDEKLSGKTVHTIKTKSKELYDRVQNVMIPVTVIRCDNSKSSHMDYLFTIFHRLNSGGLKLNNQEIRNCIYNGSLNTLLKKLAKSPETKKIFGTKSRFSNEEMILRFLAFNERHETYNGKLSKFLNDYMFDHKNISEKDIKEKIALYSETVDLVFNKILKKHSPSLMGKTFLEGLLFGISKNLNKIKQKSELDIKNRFEKFKKLPEYSQDSLKEGLSAKEKVLERLNSSERFFSN